MKKDSRSEREKQEHRARSNTFKVLGILHIKGVVTQEEMVELALNGLDDKTFKEVRELAGDALIRKFKDEARGSMVRDSDGIKYRRFQLVRTKDKNGKATVLLVSTTGGNRELLEESYKQRYEQSEQDNFRTAKDLMMTNRSLITHPEGPLDVPQYLMKYVSAIEQEGARRSDKCRRSKT